MKSGKVGMEYMNFEKWSEANQAPRTLLALHDEYFCAPQVFWFGNRQFFYPLSAAQRSQHKKRFALALLS